MSKKSSSPEEQRLFREFLRELRADDLRELREERIVQVSGRIGWDAYREISCEIESLAISGDGRILLQINSLGGAFAPCWGLVNIIDAVSQSIEVWTLVDGIAYSGAALLAMAGTKGRRYAFERASLMLHKLRGDLRGMFDDLNVEWKQIKTLQKELERFIAKRSRLSITATRVELQRDRFFSAAEAVKVGIVDEIVNDFSLLWIDWTESRT